MPQSSIPTNTVGQQRAVVERISPEIDGGRFYAKAIINEIITVEADIIIDGHDKIAARLLYKHENDKSWQEIIMQLVSNDCWIGRFIAEKEGFYHYTVEAWVDNVATWQHEVELKVKDGQHLLVEMMQGEIFLKNMAKRAKGNDKKSIQDAAKIMTDVAHYDEAIRLSMSHTMTDWSQKYPERQFPFRYKELKLYVDRQKAGFSTWYSMFPRSAARELGKHGTFADVEKLLPRIATMGFDVLYLPPIHPIGITNRKGKNNTVNAQEGDAGVPYGIGSELGGHTAIHSELGTLEDFKHLIAECKKFDIEIAMDLAIQCSPDHPWVKDHPDWFKILPDGTIKYAENPPKKYQDIYPVYFETEDWQNLWKELLHVMLTWAEWGVKIIRVDNPHTKSFVFWEWAIAEVKAKYPDMIFLAEAFTKPKVMQQLAKLGYTQSYTYYVWRTKKAEIMEYMTELTKGEMKDYFRPNFWPNTHDIDPYQLQTGHEPLFLIRFFMAATLASNYGIYGPTYEYLYFAPYPNKEEYLNSEKYEIKWWNWEHKNKLTYVITEVNRIRRENTAFKSTNNIEFCEIANEQLLAYLKTATDGNRILCIVNLDGYNKQGGFIQIPLWKIGKSPTDQYRVHDLITGATYTWKGELNYVELDPNILPFHLFRIEDI
jgi:starch synthase (maltosyl-transferring)